VVQIGNIHLGRAETAERPKLDAGEAFILWDLLLSRYDIIQKTQIYQNLGHDPDLKVLLTQGLSSTLEKQVNILEREMNTFNLPLPARPPKSVRLPEASGILEDEFMFRDVFFGMQGFLDYHARTIRSFTTNDKLRAQLINFAVDELHLFDLMVKFGKLKGWLRVPPSLNLPS